MSPAGFSHRGHYVEKCQHGLMIGQCRCPGPKPEIIGPCSAVPDHDASGDTTSSDSSTKEAKAHPGPRVLSFDPSMAHSAAVLIDFGRGKIESQWEHVPRGLLSGNLGYLMSYPALAEAVGQMMGIYSSVDLVVHEMPPPSGHLARPESALLASAAIRHQAVLLGLAVEGVDPRHAKRLVTGNPNATKPQIRLWFTQHLGWWSLSNEHQRDAALVGIAWYIERYHLKVDDWLQRISSAPL